MTTVLGFGAAALVGRDSITAANKAGNSAAPLLALQLGGGPGTLGGEVLVAFISAVTFATILAVVAGLINQISATTVAAISAVPAHPKKVSVGRALKRPITESRVTTTIMTVMIGTATMPLSTALQTSIWMGWIGV
jgi:cation/acetate symporter